MRGKGRSAIIWVDEMKWRGRQSLNEKKKEREEKSQMLISPDLLLRPHLGDNVSGGQTDVSLWALFLNLVRTFWGRSRRHPRGHRPVRRWSDPSRRRLRDPRCAMTMLHVFFISLAWFKHRFIKRLPQAFRFPNPLAGVTIIPGFPGPCAAPGWINWRRLKYQPVIDGWPFVALFKWLPRSHLIYLTSLVHHSDFNPLLFFYPSRGNWASFLFATCESMSSEVTSGPGYSRFLSAL